MRQTFTYSFACCLTGLPPLASNTGLAFAGLPAKPFALACKIGLTFHATCLWSRFSANSNLPTALLACTGPHLLAILPHLPDKLPDFLRILILISFRQFIKPFIKLLLARAYLLCRWCLSFLRCILGIYCQS